MYRYTALILNNAACYTHLICSLKAALVDPYMISLKD